MRSGFSGFDLSDLAAVEFDLTPEEQAELDSMPALSSAIPSIPDEDDELFSSLFAASSLSQVHVSPALAASTLDAIMAQAQDSQAFDLAEPPRHLKLVTGGAYAASERKPRRVVSAVGRLQRIAAAAAVAALGLGGGLAYNTPTAYVTVEGADSSVQLGVNVFGVTVSAVASNPAAQEALDSLSVGGLGYEDSLRQVVDSLTTAGDSEANTASVTVSSPLGGQKSRLEDGSTKVLDDLAAARALTQAVSPEDAGSASGSSSSSASEKPEAPAKPEPAKAETEEKPAAESQESSAGSSSESASGSGSASQGSSSGSGSAPVRPAAPEQPAEPELPDTPAEDIDFSGASPVEPAENIGYGREDEDEAPATGELPAVPVAPPSP